MEQTLHDDVLLDIHHADQDFRTLDLVLWVQAGPLEMPAKKKNFGGFPRETMH